MKKMKRCEYDFSSVIVNVYNLFQGSMKNSKKGAMTLSITSFSIMTLSIMTLSITMINM
jgi:hypothetical protein